jgi:hypothetical protein
MNEQKCAWCQIAGNVFEKIPDPNLVFIHKKCLKIIIKQVSDSLAEINKIQNQCSDSYGKIYSQYKDTMPKPVEEQK